MNALAITKCLVYCCRNCSLLINNKHSYLTVPESQEARSILIVVLVRVSQAAFKQLARASGHLKASWGQRTQDTLSVTEPIPAIKQTVWPQTVVLKTLTDSLSVGLQSGSSLDNKSLALDPIVFLIWRLTGLEFTKPNSIFCLVEVCPASPWKWCAGNQDFPHGGFLRTFHLLKIGLVDPDFLTP